eukprot:jgi/Hompol1/4806/HPOL_001277-RA
MFNYLLRHTRILPHDPDPDIDQCPLLESSLMQSINDAGLQDADICFPLTFVTAHVSRIFSTNETAAMDFATSLKVSLAFNLISAMFSSF